MKKISILLAAFCGITLNANAQLKVDSIGRTFLGDYTESPVSRLTVVADSSDNYAAQFKGLVKCDEWIAGKALYKTSYGVHQSMYTLSTLDHILFLDTGVLGEIPLPGRDNAGEDESEANTKSVVHPINQELGISAASLALVLPKLLKTDKEGNYYADYAGMVPHLVKAIQQLNAMILQLQASSTANQLESEDSESENTVPGQSRLSQSLLLAHLYQNSPNPFSERTTIRFTLPDDAQQAYIYIFDMTGKMLRQIPVDGTMQSVTINGYELSPGMYIYSLVVNGQEIDAKRMILSSK